MALLPACEPCVVDEDDAALVIGADPLVVGTTKVEGRFGDSESDAESQASSSAHDASIYELIVELVLLLKWVEAGCRMPSMLLCGRGGGEYAGDIERQQA